MLRKILLGLAGLVVSLVIFLILFYLEEDWRGAHEWAACQKELQARGETLDLRQLVPPGKPEDDLSKAPIFTELCGHSARERRPLRRKQLRNEVTGLVFSMGKGTIGPL